MENVHKPVLLKEVINFLDIKEGRKYIDCTFGFGGHSVEILKRGGNVLGLDSDKESLSEAREKLLATSPWLLAEDSKKLIASGRKLEASLILENANFSKLEQVAKEVGLSNPVDDIKKWITVSTVRDTQIIQVTVKTTNPGKIAATMMAR